MLVVAAAIRDSSGCWLLQKRPRGKHHAGLWEFPGGKVDRGEELRAALVREVAEELGLALDRATIHPLGFVDEPAGAGRPPLVLLLFAATVLQGDPVGHEGQLWGWFARADAVALPLAPLDRALLACLPN
jgi:8-oxo-dGTP diphosphatase